MVKTSFDPDKGPRSIDAGGTHTYRPSRSSLYVSLSRSLRLAQFHSGWSWHVFLYAVTAIPAGEGAASRQRGFLGMGLLGCFPGGWCAAPGFPGDFWRVFRVRINFGQVPKVTGVW